MSISSTSKVSSSSSSVKRANLSQRSRSGGESFVEVIDTNNSISVRDELNDNSGQNKQEYPSKEEKQEDSKINSVGTPYVSNAIEALVASGIFDVQSDAPNTTKVNVYGNNQSIIKNEESEERGDDYLKHFYEKNEVLEELDELI